MDYKVYLQDGTEHTYTDEDLGKFVKEGTWPGYTPEQNPVINVQTNDGLISVPFTKQNVIEAVQNNFNLEDSSTATNRAWDEKVNEGSQIVNSGKALLQGFEKSATFGTSLVSRALDFFTGNEYGAEEREAIARNNPVSAFTGEALGFALPGSAAIKGTVLGSKALGSVLSKTLPGLTEQAVQGIGGMAATAAGKLGAQTAARAIEGSLVSLTNDLSAKYLDDKELGAEELAGHAAWAALIGGGAEGALGSLGLLGTKAVKKVIDVKDHTLEKIADSVVLTHPHLTKQEVLDFFKDNNIIVDMRNWPEKKAELVTNIARQETARSKEFAEITMDFNKNLTSRLSNELKGGDAAIARDEGIRVFTEVFTDTTGTGFFNAQGMKSIISDKTQKGIDEVFLYLDSLSEEKIAKLGKRAATGSFRDNVRASGAEGIAERIKQLKEEITGYDFGQKQHEIIENFFDRAIKLRKNISDDLRKAYERGTDKLLGSQTQLMESALSKLDGYLSNTSAFGKAGDLARDTLGSFKPYLNDLQHNKSVPNIWTGIDKKGRGKIYSADEGRVNSFVSSLEKYPDRLTRLNSRMDLRDSVIRSIESFADKIGDTQLKSRCTSFLGTKKAFDDTIAETMKQAKRIGTAKTVSKRETLGLMRQIGPFSVGWAITGSPIGGTIMTVLTGIAEDPMVTKQFIDMRRKLAGTSTNKFANRVTSLVESLASGAASTTRDTSRAAKKLASNYPSLMEHEDKHENIRQLTPEAVKQFIDERMGDVLSVDPALRSALETKMVDLLRNIQKDLPQMKQPLLGKPIPSKVLKNNNVNDKIAIAADVSKIVDIIQSGRINKEVMDFFANNYPKHYQALVRKFTDRLPDIKNTAANRRLLSLVLGTPVSKSQEHIQHLQKTYELKGTPNQARPAGRVTERKMQKDKIAHLSNVDRISYGVGN